MIPWMPPSRALLTFLVATLVACGGSPKTSDEPQTAKEKQMREAKASGELDGTNKKWGTWRYSGDRDDCFYVVGRRCFKTKQAACTTLGCKTGKKCSVVGGGPATVSCK
ncbi:MAG: hypothetical protein H0V17_26440 [Deltaproteobacteria bacterium]|nr:hypothetical protein [Deltaproteobacteria bacterium]